MRLYYFPEFWVLLVACLYGGTAMLYALYQSTKRDKKFTAFVQKYLDQEEKKKPNIGIGTITKNYDINCGKCHNVIRIGVTDRENVRILENKGKI